MRTAMRLDLLLYAVSTVFAAATAFGSEFYGYRVWGNFATAGYLVAFGLTAWTAHTGRGSRWWPVLVAGVLGTVAPLLTLAWVRDPGFRWGNWPWSFPAQPEVWVVERSASLLLRHGTPYTDLATLGRAPHPDDYTPYGPSMTLFGLPRALLGDHPLTDSRVWFLLGAVAAVWVAWHVVGRPAVPVRAAQLAAVTPLTTLTFSVAGDDLTVIALVVLACALAYRAGPGWTGAVCALAVTMKMTALPAAVVLGVGVLACRGGRAFAVFLGTLLATGAVIVGPVLAADPASFVEHVVKFPVGLGRATSPASSPLPGHLIAQTGPLGHTVALVLLGAAACAIGAWLLARPPRSASAAAVRVAVGLGAAILLAPATRWGYLVYPLALFGAALALPSGGPGRTDPGVGTAPRSAS